jgi:hypothetical protein
MTNHHYLRVGCHIIFVGWATRQPRVTSGAPYIHRFISAPPPRPSIFIGDVSPTNVTRYIYRFHVTNEYAVYSSVPMNNSI